MAKKVLVIGAGMAGTLVSILLAREGCKVTLFERNKKIGKKILVTGNGRCNISNIKVRPDRYHSMTDNFTKRGLDYFGLEETKDLLFELGIDTVEGEDGKLYPRSLQASSVVQSLLMELEHKNIQIIYEDRVQEIEYTNKYKISHDGKNYYGDYLVLATGGKSYADSGSSGDGYYLSKNFGHHVTEVYPSIVQLRTDSPFSKMLKGLKVMVKARLLDDKFEAIRLDEGEVLFTDYGLSGPTILQLSTMVEPSLSMGKSYWISLDFMKDFTEEELDAYLIDRFRRFPSRTLSEILNGVINSRLIPAILKASDVSLTKKSCNITKEERSNLLNSLKDFRQGVTGTYIWNQAQVTKGGVSCKEINGDTLESTLQKGLYFVGEVMDIDGDCGGYNLQWAISSAALCAKAISES